MKKLAKASLLLLLLGLSIEIAVRISGRAGSFATDPAFEQAPSGSYWRYLADSQFTVYGPTDIVTGPLGERTHGPHGSQDPDSGPIVAVFGDSFTFGQAVANDETWPAQLERVLQTRFPGIRVLNFGVQGHSLRMIIAHARDRLRTIRPALVVLAFIGDDLDPDRERKHVDRFGYLARGGPNLARDRASETLRALARQSHALLWLKHWHTRAFPAQPVATAPEGTAAGKELQSATVLPANLPGLLDRLGDTPLILAELDLADTKNSLWLRRELPRALPGVPLVYMPPSFRSAQDFPWRVPGDGHPSPQAHALYATVLAPPVSTALVNPMGTSPEAGTATEESP